MDRSMGRTTVSETYATSRRRIAADLTNSKRPSFYPDTAPDMDRASRGGCFLDGYQLLECSLSARWAVVLHHCHRPVKLGSYPTHGVWAAVFLVIIARKSGVISVGHWLA